MTPNVFHDRILAQLAAILSCGPAAIGPDQAREAAEQAIAAYDPRTQGEPVAIAQIVALGFVALDDLRLSVPPEQTLTLKLKLRGNAAALSRASQQAAATRLRDRLAQEDPTWREDPSWREDPTWRDQAPDPEHQPPPRPAQQDEPASQQDEPAQQPEPPSQPEPAVQPEPQQSQPAIRPSLPLQTPWAAGMTRIAAELRARAKTAPQSQRKLDQAWIEALTDAAQDLDTTPHNKAKLLTTTLMPAPNPQSAGNPKPAQTLRPPR